MSNLNTAYNFSSEQQRKIQSLKDKIEDCNDMSVGNEDIFMSKYLFFTNWDVDKAFDSIKRYYKFKAEHPNWVAHHAVEYFREEFLDIKAKFLMPMPDKMGRPVLIFKTVDCFSKYPNYMQDLIEMDDLIFESLLLVPHVQESGITIIFDLNGITASFFPMLTPRMARLINEKNKVLPFSKRYIHIIQNGFIMNAASSMIMPFLSRNLKEHQQQLQPQQQLLPQQQSQQQLIPQQQQLQSQHPIPQQQLLPQQQQLQPQKQQLQPQQQQLQPEQQQLQPEQQQLQPEQQQLQPQQQQLQPQQPE